MVDRLWLVNKGTVTTYEGSLEDYRNFQLEKEKKTKKQDINCGNERKKSRKNSAMARQRIAPLKQNYLRLEKEVHEAQNRLKSVDKQLETPNLFISNPDKAVSLGQERARLDKQIEILESRWFEALDLYEKAKTKEGLI